MPAGQDDMINRAAEALRQEDPAVPVLSLATWALRELSPSDCAQAPKADRLAFRQALRAALDMCQDEEPPPTSKRSCSPPGTATDSSLGELELDEDDNDSNDPFPVLVQPSAASSAQKVDVARFLETLYATGPQIDLNDFTPTTLVMDVRSPGEFAKGHIPGAINIPLFTNAERAVVGTTFKKVGRLDAIQRGLRYVGPKMSQFVDAALANGIKPGGDRTCFVYCWRGGMRSSSVGWLLTLCSFPCAVLNGGYKGFRRWVDARVGHSVHDDDHTPYTSPTRALWQPHLKLKTGGPSKLSEGTPASIVHFEAASALASEQRWEEAGEAYSESLATGHPQPHLCYHRRGVMRMHGDKLEEAMQDFGQALDRAPAIQTTFQSKVLYDRSLAHQQVGAYAEAETDLVAAVEANKGWKVPQVELANLRRIMKEDATNVNGEQSTPATSSTASSSTCPPSSSSTNSPTAVPSAVPPQRTVAVPPAVVQTPILKDEAILAQEKKDKQTAANVVVLGGRTGSGKTHVLRCLMDMGEQVIDLEGLAIHKGSAFGRVGFETPQPTTEQFENYVAIAWYRADPTRRVWFEHEDQHVGLCRVPHLIYDTIRTAPGGLMVMDVPQTERVKHLVKDYCGTDGRATDSVTTDLKLAINALTKRLGPDKTANALQALADHDYAFVAQLSLDYYDRLYDKHEASNRSPVVIRVPCESADAEMNARLVMQALPKREPMSVASTA